MVMMEDSMRPGTVVEKLGKFDVLLGRGIGPNGHPGNQRYRQIVHSNQPEYLATKKRKEKEKIARRTILDVSANGARFLKPIIDHDSNESTKKDETNKYWVIVEHSTVLEKTKQALRFVGHHGSKKRCMPDDFVEGTSETTSKKSADPPTTQASSMEIQKRSDISSVLLAEKAKSDSSSHLRSEASRAMLLSALRPQPPDTILHTSEGNSSDALLRALSSHSSLDRDFEVLEATRRLEEVRRLNSAMFGNHSALDSSLLRPFSHPSAGIRELQLTQTYRSPLESLGVLGLPRSGGLPSFDLGLGGMHGVRHGLSLEAIRAARAESLSRIIPEHSASSTISLPQGVSSPFSSGLTRGLFGLPHLVGPRSSLAASVAGSPSLTSRLHANSHVRRRES